MQQRENVALERALTAGREQFLRAWLRIDWQHDGSWDGPAVDLSDNIQQLSYERIAQGELPDEVNGLVGASSSELTITLVGTEADTGLDIYRVFSPYHTVSPFRGRDLAGCAVRLDMVTDTEIEPTTTRVFTGWVRSMSPKRAAGTVELTCADNLHILGTSVTLPRWARWRRPEQQHDNDRWENAPMSLAWPMHYILRRAGALPGADPRPECKWFMSGAGGMMPEIGTFVNHGIAGVPPVQGFMFYTYGDSPVVPPLPMPGDRDAVTLFAYNAQTSDTWTSSGKAGLTKKIVPGGTPRYCNVGCWAFLENTNNDSQIRVHMLVDAVDAPVSDIDKAQLYLDIYGGGTYLNVRNTTGTQNFIRRADPIPAKQWVYVSMEVDFENLAASRVFYGDTQQTLAWWTGSVGSTGAMRAAYHLNVREYNTQRNRGELWFRGAAFADAEIWDSPSRQTTRVVGWENGDYTRKDFYLDLRGEYLYSDVAQVNQQSGGNSVPAMTHLPQRVSVDGWELLKEIVGAMQGVMHVNEHGGLVIIPQPKLGLYDNLTDPVKVIDADYLQDYTTWSNFDSVRNIVRYGEARARSIVGVNFTANDVEQFRTLAGTEQAIFQFAAPKDLISIDVGPIAEWADGTDTNDLEYQGYRASATNGVAFRPESSDTSAYAVAVHDSGRQDELRIATMNRRRYHMLLAFPNSPAKPPTQPAFKTGGVSLQKDETLHYEVRDEGSIERAGERILELPDSDWHSCQWSMPRTARSLLSRAVQFAPIADTVPMLGDPRLQLLDCVAIEDPQGGVVRSIAQITGISASYSPSDGFRNTLRLRILASPDQWLLGDPELSVLGHTTILS